MALMSPCDNNIESGKEMSSISCLRKDVMIYVNWISEILQIKPLTYTCIIAHLVVVLFAILNAGFFYRFILSYSLLIVASVEILRFISFNLDPD